MRAPRPFAYTWAWATPSPPPGKIYAKVRQSGYFDRDRKGERCRVLARGTKNSVLIEFEDGYKVCTTRHGLKKRRVTPRR